MTMSSCAKYFKTAFIQYQSKDNAELRGELIQTALSCQKNISSQTQTMLESNVRMSMAESKQEEMMNLEATLYKTAKVSSIKKQLKDITAWLTGQQRGSKPNPQINKGVNSTVEDDFNEQLLTSESEKSYRRFIVFSICASDDLIIEDMNGLNIQPVTALIEALLASLEMLSANDFVCINIGNSSLRLFNDNQA